MGGSTEQKSNSSQATNQATSQNVSGTQTSAIDPRYQQIQLDNLAHAQGVAGGLNTPYTGALSAGYGNTVMPQAIAGTQGLAGYNAPTISAGQLASTDLSPYLNPYTSNVIDTTNAGLSRQNNIDNTNAAGAATAAHAFGGSRSAVLQNLNTDSYQRNLNATDAGLNQANFAQAQGAAQQDIAGRYAADAANQGANIASAGVRGTANNLLGQFGQAQQSQQQDALSRAYNAWLQQQQAALAGQSLLNSTVGGLTAPVTATTVGATNGTAAGTATGTGDTTTSQNPGLGSILGTAAQIGAMFF